MAGPEDLDVLAASLRADAGDLDAFVEALASLSQDLVEEADRSDRGRQALARLLEG